MRGRKNRIVVISRNAVMADFFRMEAQACGCPIRVVDKPPASLRDFERVVLDSEVGVCVSDHADCLVAVIVNNKEAMMPITFQECWEWPVSVETVRAFFEGMSAEIDGEREPDVPNVYLLSNEKRELLYCNRRITLTPHEWRILMLLGESEGAIVSRDRLREALGDEQGNMVDVYIHHLRKKLEEDRGVRLIYTVRGRGYRLDLRMKDLCL